MKNMAKEVTRQPWKGCTITLREYSVENTYPSGILTCTPPHDSREGGEGARIRQDSPAQSEKVIGNDQLE